MKSNKLIYILLSGLVLSCNNPQSKQKEATPNATSKAVSKEEQAFLTEIKYSNLVDKISQEEVKKALIEAGVRPERLNSFFESVELFNQTVDEAGMVSQGFLTSNELKPNYDEATIATQWRAKYPDFLGYNCPK